MNVGDVVTLRGVHYYISSIRPDGEPCLTRLDLNLVRAPGGGFLGQ